MDAFQAIADPTRRAILGRLASGERSAGEIGADFPISAPAVSQHLRALREAGLVRVRGEGQRRIYALERRGFKPLEDWLSHTRQFWEARLDALESALRAADAMEQGEHGK